MINQKKNIILSIFFAVLLIIVVLFLFFNSADFISPPEILLPTTELEDTSNIFYKNKYIIDSVTINNDNVLDVISSLNRPLEYSCKLQKTIYAFDSNLTEFSDVFVSPSKVLVVENNKRTLIDNETVFITSKNITKTYSLQNFSFDEIIGIQTYEDISNIKSSSLELIDDVKYIKIISQNEQKTIEYYIDLTNGLLVKYYEFYQDTKLKEVLLSNILIGEQNPDIFLN